MRRLVSLIVSFLLVLSFPLTAFADNSMPAQKFNKDDYVAYSLQFAHADGYDQQTAQRQASEAVSAACQMIREINLDARGFVGATEYYQSKLQKLLEGDAILQDYTIYIPKAGISRDSTQENFGSYDGIPMIAIYEVYNVQYLDRTYDEDKIVKWASAAVNLVMEFLPQFITIPYSILSTFVPPAALKARGPIVEVNWAEEVTDRIVYCQDKLGRWGEPTSQYVGVFADVAKVVRTSTILFPNSPYYPPSITGSTNPTTISTTDFFNAYAIRVAAYNQYAFGVIGDMTVRSLGSGNIAFR